MRIEIPKQLQNPDFRFIRLQPKSKIPLKGISWKENMYTYNDPILLQHIEEGGNYGVVAGYGNLRILDVDNIELANKILSELDTFAVKSCGGGCHFYSLCDDDINKSSSHGEYRARDQYVVGPGCYVDDERKNHHGFYGVMKDLEINIGKSDDIINQVIGKENKTKKQDNSRSGLEYRKILALLAEGKSREEIYKIMESYSKWKESPESYRTLTFEKAEDFYLNGKENETFPKSINIFTNKLELAKQFIKIQPIYYERKNQFWVWDFEKCCWTEKDETDILNLISRNSNVNTISSKEKTEILEALKQVGRQNKPLDIKPTWVQFKNKIYDILTEEVFEATPEYFIANPINWKVGDSEETPTIDRLIKSWVKEEDILRLYEVIAFVIITKYFIHSFFFLYSPPGMGKSTFVNLLIKFIGKHNHTSTSIARINNNTRFETLGWYRKLLITIPEVSNVDDLKNTGAINQGTGEDPIKAEIKGGATFEFINYAKLICPTNKLLKVDNDDGFGRRVRTIKFITRFEKEKDVLEEIPDWEFENLAKKSLRIAKELWQKRQFTGDLSISERMKQYQEISKTPLERFIDESCDLTDSNAKIPFDEFYSGLSKFLLNNKKEIPTKIMVGKDLKKLGFETKNHSWKVEQKNFLETWITKNTLFGIKFKGGI